MGAFALVRKDGNNSLPKLSENILQQFSSQGFTTPITVDDPGYQLYIYPKLITESENLVQLTNGDFCAYTGTLLFNGTTGTAALRNFLDSFDPDNFNLNGIYGSFCIILRKSARTFLLTDHLGIYKVYRTNNDLILASSFLAATAATYQRNIETQSIYEYIFQGATYGGRTVFQSIQLVDSGDLYEIAPLIRKHRIPHRLTGHLTPPPAADLSEEIISKLNDIYQSITDCFGNSIDTAISGGYDSRLTLALLFKQGIKPNIHVYGKSNDADVRIAKAIAHGESFDLSHTDKSKFEQISISEFPRIIEENYQVFDGYPNDGIFNNGADLATRRMRCSNGDLMLNGGGGEIFRNFFYLRNKSYTIKHFLWSFYSRFDPKVCTTEFSEQQYFEQLDRKIRNTLNIDTNILSRYDIELLYPLFRCRYWMGRNNSVNNRLGYALTPFIEHVLIESTVAIPIAQKNYGRFEANLINTINPQLAAYPSDYGHDFSGEPPLLRKLKDLSTILRPPMLRKYTYRVKTRRNPSCLPYTLTPSYIATVIDRNCPYMRNFIHIDHIRDTEQLNRIFTLEYLFQKTNASFMPSE